MNHIPWLSIVLVVPLIAAVLIVLIPKSRSTFTYWIAIVATSVIAVIVAGLIISLPGTASSTGPLAFHYTETHSWISAIGASYSLGLDGLSAWFLGLNAGVFLIGAIVAYARKVKHPQVFLSLMFVAQCATAGVLLSTDLLLFYIFWEGMLLPLYFLLSTYGNENRRRATVKFVGYTVAGSLLMLLGIIYLHIHAPGNTFNINQLIAHPGTGGGRLNLPYTSIPTLTSAQFAFLAFAIAFAIKVPLVPFHTWLPDLYESCPTSGLMFFAGIVSKLGAFGFLRYAITLFPGPAHQFQWLFESLAVISIIYGALMALQERDVKRVVAYSSISHLGFIVLGIFTLTSIGISGAVIQVVNHGIIIIALFLIVEMIEVRTETRDLGRMHGLEKRMPVLYFLFLITTLAALGMPGLNGFVGEFTIMLGAFQVSWLLAVLAGIGVILASWYMLRMHQGLMHEPLHDKASTVHDLLTWERLLLIPLVALMVFIGMYPNEFATIDRSSIGQYVTITQPLVSSTTSPQGTSLAHTQPHTGVRE